MSYRKAQLGRLAPLSPNQAFLDEWSPMHFLVGIVFGAVGTRWPTFAVLHAGYEGAEQLMERTEPVRRFFRAAGPESLLNVAGDTAVASVGWAIGRWLREQP